MQLFIGEINSSRIKRLICSLDDYGCQVFSLGASIAAPAMRSRNRAQNGSYAKTAMERARSTQSNFARAKKIIWWQLAETKGINTRKCEDGRSLQ